MTELLRKGHFLGPKLRSIRRRNGLTLEELSVRCIQDNPDIAPSVSYLSMIESGKRTPSPQLLELRVLIEKPRRRALKHPGEELEQLRRGRALAALDHAQVRDRGRDVRVILDAAHRQLFQRQPVAPAYGAQLGTQEVTFAQQFRHMFSPRPCSTTAPVCSVKLTV